MSDVQQATEGEAMKAAGGSAATVEEIAKAANLTRPTEPWPALAGWLEGFVRYTKAKRTLVTERHEVFEESPDLDATDLMQMVGGMRMARGGSLEQNQRLLGLVLNGIRTPVSST